MCMLYGELMIQQKHDYTESSIFKKWFCFGAVLQANKEEDNVRIVEDLRAAGYSAIVKEGLILISPNDQLFTLLKKVAIPTVADYKPKSLTDEKFATTREVPTFESLNSFLTSDLSAQYYLNPNTGPLGEGMVISLVLNGEKYKVKHGGECCGNQPEKIQEALEFLKEFPEFGKAIDVLVSLQTILRAKYHEEEKKYPEEVLDVEA